MIAKKPFPRSEEFPFTASPHRLLSYHTVFRLIISTDSMASVHSSERTLRAESTLDSKVDASLDESTDEVLYSDKFVTLKRTALIVRYICLLQTKIST